MFGRSAKLPVSDEDRRWVNQGFGRLEKMLGRRRMMEAKVVLPTAEDFPDPFSKTPEALEKLFQRMCGYMHVERRNIELEIFPDETEELRRTLPYWQGDGGGCAGIYTHDTPAADGEMAKQMVVAIRSTQLEDPLLLIATIAHELGHVILLGGGLIDWRTKDHEPLTDLLTIFLGFGVFTSNAAGRFTQFQEEHRYGWSMQRLGYLPEEVHGYALAKFAVERGDDKGEWTKFLSTNVRTYYKQSRSWLKENPHDITLAEPIG